MIESLTCIHLLHKGGFTYNKRIQTHIESFDQTALGTRPFTLIVQ